MTDSWLNRVPFENDPLRRWLALPIALIAYAPTVLIFYHTVGPPAFGLVAFVVAAGVGAVAGVRVGIVTAFCMQAANFPLAWIVEDDSSDPVVLAAAAFAESAILALATGGLRALWQRMARTNRVLDEQIRARRAVEASLDESLSLHRNLVSTLGEGVGLFDPEDNFVFANPAADRIFGVSEGRLVGRSLEDFLTPESADELRRWRSLLRDEPVSYELQLADSELRVLLVTDTRMATSGTAGEGQTLRVMRDMSERARLERERCELQQYLQHTEALRSLAVMAGGVAHDFNNLLGGVIGNTELGLLKLSESPSFARSCLEEARGFALEASELSHSMLAYAGKRNAAPKSLELAEEVDAALRLVNALISKRAALANRIPANLPPLKADRTGLHQVVTNLVLNATEAIGDDLRATLSLDARVEEVAEGRFGSIPSTSAPKAGRYVVLSVSDTGPGMSKDVLSRLFEPFFSTKFSGRGMGLSATLGIVRAHGGGITVESEPGVGTTFRVYWPAAEASIGSEESRDSSLSSSALRVER